MTLPVRDPETIETRMADGARLVADVWRPAGPGRHPVLLMRQPYGRRIASTVVLAHPAWYAAQGFVVMVQDVRGRGDSEGRFRILADDVQDGAATLAAAADLSGGDGRVATYGFSYQGMTQFMGLAGALAAGTVKPAAMAVAMAPWNVRDHWAFRGGAFQLHGNQLWAVQMAAENARIAGDAAAYHAFRSAASRLCSGPVPARLDVFDAHPHLTHYLDWLADDPAYWSSASPHAVLAGRRLDVPSLHVGGWLDVMIDGTFAAYDAFAAGGAETRLTVGPWAHIPWGRHVGALDCGEEAGAGGDAAFAGFLRHVLHGDDLLEAPVRLFDLGRRCFAGFGSLPRGRRTTLHLASTGRAAPTVTDGRLTPEAVTSGVDRLVHDPWRPAPSGGAGYHDRSAIDDRGDVAVYTSEPLTAETVLCGAAVAEIVVEADRPSFDLHATLSVLLPDGPALVIASGTRRCFAGEETAPAPVQLHPTMMTLPVGSRVRLSLAAAAYPAFMVNPGTGRRPEYAALSDCLVTTLAIGHDGSRLVLTLLD
ncbi:CocE/NonD family hydrolase [Chthonobacter rhizosphaerae]|uniref:CocE/NonD family hydrolase n=1 Tax=Chthonobacter rhizosphaerae TaxID=2735553 RepID=UPI0015EE9CCF|nr:CocE/NonD family hydrolase [Chthonobacter rhizosphaerae]